MLAVLVFTSVDQMLFYVRRESIDTVLQSANGHVHILLLRGSLIGQAVNKQILGNGLVFSSVHMISDHGLDLCICVATGNAMPTIIG